MGKQLRTCRGVRRAITAARSLSHLYDQLQSAPGNAENRGISDEAERARRWLAVLESEPSLEDVNEIWREVQHSGHTMDGTWKPPHLSKSKDLLLDDLFSAMLDLVAEARRLRS